MPDIADKFSPTLSLSSIVSEGENFPNMISDLFPLHFKDNWPADKILDSCQMLFDLLYSPW